MQSKKENNSKKIVVAVGELLWDFFPSSKEPGGAPANVAFHVDQLGLEGIIVSAVGTDSLGNDLLLELEKRKIQTGYIEKNLDHPTGTVTVDVTDVTQPAYTIHNRVAWDHIKWNQETEDLVKRASAICFGTLAQRDKESRNTIYKCLETVKDALIVYDVNLREKHYEKEWIEFSLTKANVVKLNAVEVFSIGKLLGLDVASYLKTARQIISKYNVSTVCITRSNRGCLVVTKDQAIDVPGLSIKVIETTGAGDAFTAAFIYATLNGWPIGKTTKFANKIGSLVAARQGSMPLLKEEFDMAKKEILKSKKL